MKLDILNVGFGDCFVFKQENLKSSYDTVLVVDCGSRSFSKCKNQFKSNKRLGEDIYKNYINKSSNNNALITHFHSDHISGFKYLSKNYKKPFDKIYIPYLYVCDKKSNKPVLLELAIYYYLLFGKNSPEKQLSEDILRQITMVTDLSCDINCLSRDNVFKFNNIEYKVLWPMKKLDFNEMLNEDLAIVENELGEIENLDNIKNEILNNMKNWFELCSDRNVVNENSEDSIIQIQKGLIKELDVIKDIYEELLFTTALNYKKERYGALNRFINDNNSISIVFQNLLSSIDSQGVASEIDSNDKKPILMTGDITSEIIDNNLKRDFHNCTYEIIKAPHHGTNSHFSGSLPISKKIIITSGKRKNYGIISKNYQFPKTKRWGILCTSGGCNCEVRAPHTGTNCINGKCFIDGREELDI